MLLASRFNRPKAPIEIGDKVYYFTPLDPTNPNSEHVCEVADKSHIAKLLAIPEGYYIPEDDEPVTTPAARPKAAATAPVAPPPPVDPPAAPVTPPSGAIEHHDLPEEIQEAARNLNALSWQALQAQVKKEGIPPQVLREALRIEQEKPEADRRGTTIKILTAAIGGG
jgi:hypothetical protein